MSSLMLQVFNNIIIVIFILFLFLFIMLIIRVAADPKFWDPAGSGSCRILYYRIRPDPDLYRIQSFWMRPDPDLHRTRIRM